jgi:hypothetical protein
MGRRDGARAAAMPKRGLVLGRRSAAQRKTDRRALGSLQSLVVAPSTRGRYFQAVSRFLEFLQLHGYGYPCTFSSLDGHVCEFIEYLWHNGEPKAFASDCLSGLGHFIPATKKHLVGGWRLHGSWSRAELPARAIPFTPVMVYAIAQKAFEKGWEDLCLLVLLGFDRFARTGELFAATKQDFVFNHSRSKVVWSLPLTKSGQRVGAQESLVVEDPWLVRALSNYLRSLQNGDTLRHTSPGVMRSRLKQLLLELNFSDGFQWYSLRRGGATHLFRSSNNMSQVCMIGRWNCQKTARIYVTDALSQLTEISASLATRQRWLMLAKKARPKFSFDL